MAASPAVAEIAGERVVSGEASFQRDGDITTIRASDGAVIDYRRLNVWAHEELHFVQPHRRARVLNRVRGDATRIDGALFANGIVYLVNPAGIFFGNEAVVDVGGLIAAAGHIETDDFLAGRDHFDLVGAVEQQGRIEAASVALLGRTVAQRGHIRAPEGTVALVAGERVVLARLGSHLVVEAAGLAGDGKQPALEHSGAIDADRVSFTAGDVYSLAIRHEGWTRANDIELEADSGTLEVSGTLDASDLREGAEGGSIRLRGERIALLGARLDASGDAAGGTLEIGGGLRGSGGANARRLYVDANSRLVADAIARGDGGRVILWSDEATAFHGAISARGGAAGGDGGFAEISSAGLLRSDGDVDLGAAAGRVGTLLYDPQDIVLMGGQLDGSDSPDLADDRLAGDGDDLGLVLFGDVGVDMDMPFVIYESEIEGSDADIVLEARNSITSQGTFDHIVDGEDEGVVRIVDGRSLTMRTRNDVDDEVGGDTPGIALGAVDFEATSGGDLSFATGNDGAGGGGSGASAAIALGALSSVGGDVSVTTADGAITLAGVVTSGADDATGGNAGSITIIANDADAGGGSDVSVTGDLVARGGEGTAGAGGRGGAITVRSEGAEVDIGGESDPVHGGGDVQVANADSRGGVGTADGGSGGNVRIETSDGTLDVASVDTSGGAGGEDGGRGGAILLRTREANMDDPNDIDTGALASRGGDGGSGRGGSGGSITVETLPSDEIADATDPDMNVQESVGGGEIRLQGDLDAREGAGEDSPFVDGGAVRVVSAKGLVRVLAGGEVDPYVRSGGNVTLEAIGDLNAGAGNPFLVEGGGEEGDELTLRAGGEADVRVDSGPFAQLNAVALSADADLDIEQIGPMQSDRIRLQGDGSEVTLLEADGRGNDVALLVALDERDPDAADPGLVIESGAVLAGGDFFALSDGDLSLRDGAVTASAVPDPDAPLLPVEAGDVQLVADLDRDGVGALSDEGANFAIDLLPAGADTPGRVVLVGGGGIGTSGNPITLRGGGEVAADVTPRLDGEPDPDSTAGLFLENIDSGELVVEDLTELGLAGLQVTFGTGDIEVRNLAGDLRVREQIRTLPEEDEGVGGDVVLGTSAPDTRTLLDNDSLLLIRSGGAQIFEGDVVLAQNTALEALGGIQVSGGLDRDDPEVEAGLDAVLGDGASLAVAGNIGSAESLSGLAVGAGEDETMILDTARIVTEAVQSYRSDVDIAQSTDLLSERDAILFAGDLDAEPSAGVVDITLAADAVSFGGDVGSNDAPNALVANAAFIRFDAADAQTVTVGAGGIQLNPDLQRGSAPVDSTIGKVDGDLRFESVGGTIAFGRLEKVGAGGRLELVGDRVDATDLSALEIDIESPDTRIHAREPDLVRVARGGLLLDGGTDLVANSVRFSSAPRIVGTGPAPRIATPSGRAQNSGLLDVHTLPATLRAGDLSIPGVLLDLAIPVSDPGFETPVLRGGPVEVPRKLIVSADAADLGPPIPPGEVVAFLECAAGRGEACAPVRSGSALDTPRASRVAADYRTLLGDSTPAALGRRALAGEAAETGQALGSQGASRSYLAELAEVLTRLRMLGLGEAGYASARAALLDAIVESIGAPGLDAARLGAAVDEIGDGLGLPLRAFPSASRGSG